MESEILPKLEHTFDKKITPNSKELVNKKTPKDDIKKLSKKTNRSVNPVYVNNTSFNDLLY